MSTGHTYKGTSNESLQKALDDALQELNKGIGGQSGTNIPTPWVVSKISGECGGFVGKLFKVEITTKR